MSRLTDLASFASRHRRLLGAIQLGLLAVFFGSLGWALRGSIHAAAHDLDNANLTLSALGCAALGAYYLAFVLGWIRILAEWGIQLSYPAALRAEMISMLAKYIPGGIWTPAARVVAARRAGVTDAALVTSSMLLEAGLSAVAGVIVFVVGLAFGTRAARGLDVRAAARGRDARTGSRRGRAEPRRADGGRAAPAARRRRLPARREPRPGRRGSALFVSLAACGQHPA